MGVASTSSRFIPGRVVSALRHRVTPHPRSPPAHPAAPATSSAPVGASGADPRARAATTGVVRASSQRRLLRRSTSRSVVPAICAGHLGRRIGVGSGARMLRRVVAERHRRRSVRLARATSCRPTHHGCKEPRPWCRGDFVVEQFTTSRTCRLEDHLAHLPTGHLAAVRTRRAYRRRGATDAHPLERGASKPRSRAAERSPDHPRARRGGNAATSVVARAQHQRGRLRRPSAASCDPAMIAQPVPPSARGELPPARGQQPARGLAHARARGTPCSAHPGITRRHRRRLQHGGRGRPAGSERWAAGSRRAHAPRGGTL